MLVFFIFVVIGAVAYVMLREGLLTAACALMNVLFSGIIACAFFEPFADFLEDMFLGGWFEGMEDAFALVALFCGTFALLKIVTGQWSGEILEYPLLVDRIGSGVLGAIAGYLLAGFLLMVLQTLPWSPNFLNFEYRVDPTSPSAGMRRVLPPDRVWLATMNRMSEVPFTANAPGFDADGAFEIKYARYRRKGP